MSSIPKTRKEMPLTPISYPTVGSMGKTGSWRTFRPEVDYSKCTRCMLCWVYCPDAAISCQEDNSPKIDYDYCKGCGICANECPVKAIAMHREEE
ncbi:ferredoxin [Candidatus Bathyarchaeota archaeon CG_4_8_14_3_um_filter_42_8]|jgi:2-oxoacid:acceptor oxidoreductase delta subunit (pyruvate/2-ketoisovalerate family)|nr:MAG: ferredoxin [Candidatus Bathyarchaeota archaeon CG_4_8_14_3_um_filter_42_8]